MVLQSRIVHFKIFDTNFRQANEPWVFFFRLHVTRLCRWDRGILDLWVIKFLKCHMQDMQSCSYELWASLGANISLVTHLFSLKPLKIKFLTLLTWPYGIFQIQDISWAKYITMSEHFCSVPITVSLLNMDSSSQGLISNILKESILSTCGVGLRLNEAYQKRGQV